MATPPISPKVTTATVGAGTSGVIGTFVLWVTGLFFGGSADASAVEATLAAVPAPVTMLVLVIVAAAFTFVAGYVKPDDRSPTGQD